MQKIDGIFDLQQQLLSLRAQRQQLLASNIANADTPNYKARDIDFAKALALATSAAGAAGGPVELARTSSTHLAGATGESVGGVPVQYRVPTQPSVDGNTVEPDYERAQFVDNALHYETDLTVLNAQIKAVLTAIQG
ncbi:MAG TPA: flagellar basal body rod protein FlgB [Burkholderiales bacterium]|nr:flagellar basal body rod protein FlgB [Burkholderiales bacterium]